MFILISDVDGIESVACREYVESTDKERKEKNWLKKKTSEYEKGQKEKTDKE